MEDIFSYKSKMNFTGFILVEPRYITSGNTKGSKNPLWLEGKLPFAFNITGSKSIPKTEPITGLVYYAEILYIETREDINNLKEGSYIQYDNRYWIISSSSQNLGPAKTAYTYTNYNQSSTTTAILTEVNINA